MTKASIQMEELNLKRELTDNEVIDIIGKQIKMLKESINEFTKGNRNDLVEKAKEEVTILEKYMPEQLSDDEAVRILDEAIAKVKATTMKDMGLVMKEITPLIKGKYDMGRLSELVKEKLS
jgi:uncharacterized protein YqeY